jgi:hypothetical protein
MDDAVTSSSLNSASYRTALFSSTFWGLENLGFFHIFFHFDRRFIQMRPCGSIHKKGGCDLRGRGRSSVEFAARWRRRRGIATSCGGGGARQQLDKEKKGEEFSVSGKMKKGTQ